MAILHSVDWEVWGGYPEEETRDLDRVQLAVPVGILLVQAYDFGLTHPDFRAQHKAAFDRLDRALEMRDESLTPGRWYLEALGGEVGEDFFIEAVRPYFELDYYLDDLECWYGHELSKPTVYHIPDTWEAYDLVAARLRKDDESWRRDEEAKAQLRAFFAPIVRLFTFWRKA